jgi:hypothetical protein
MIRSERFSGHATGIVVGGYGDKCLFPSLHAVDIDGIYFGKVKKKTINHTLIEATIYLTEAPIYGIFQS